MILLVVDTQRGDFDERLYAFEQVRTNIHTLIDKARANQVEIAYVRHDDGPGTELAYGEENYEIYDEFAPVGVERIFDKNVNSAFHKMTGLTEYLNGKGEKDIMMVGVATDYCMDATVKSGFEQGFRVIIPAYANTTYDNPYFSGETAYRYFNEFMWPERYAECISMEEAQKRLEA